uniref:L-threonine:uridine-5'-aldehyde transaldolase n=1 Tax=Sphaerisporangium sp. SANK 60911 TaxID=1354075 RepID=V5YSC5_9ACTN|nr:L-threonine:uridine-5'-aldehyde transaldolase [Sphaerisporangium sp. SANK 60911]
MSWESPEIYGTELAEAPSGTEIPISVDRLLKSWLSLTEESREALNLVPSENRMSPLAMLPLSSDFYNRYFFNDRLDSGFWQFRGGQSASHFEVDVALPSLRRLTASEYVNLRPISGLNTMLIAVAGLGGVPGSAVVSIGHDWGGHYATSALVERLGLRSVTVRVERGKVDASELERVLRQDAPTLVYLDLQNSLDPLDVPPVAAAIRTHSPGTLLHVDASHVLGLILGGAIPNPLDAGADSVGGSTHKTFPGPHKGILFTRDAEIADRLRRAQFNLLSSHHFAETISLGLAALEFENFGAAYAEQVLRNATAFGRALRHRGFDVIGDPERPTGTHQVWVRIGDAPRTDHVAENLYLAGIRVNVQTDLPGLPGAMFRLGVSEVTFEGADEDAMGLLADAFVHAADGRPGRAAGIRADIRAGMTRPYFYTGAELRHLQHS